MYMTLSELKLNIQIA